MIPIEEFEKMLDEIAEELPKEFYEQLNGGVMLLPDAKRHPEQLNVDLYIMGEYHRDAMGRYIAIYYGSFEKVYSHLSPERLRAEIRRTLRHEFTHHMESLAGEKGLEIKDAERMERYRGM